MSWDDDSDADEFGERRPAREKVPTTGWQVARRIAGYAGVVAGVVDWVPGAGVWGGPATGAGAAGTTERSWVGAGAGVGFAGLVRAGGVGPGMLDGAAGGGSLPGGVWAPAGMASHVIAAAARRMRELSMRQLCVPLHHVAHAHDSSERPKSAGIPPCVAGSRTPSGPVYRSQTLEARRRPDAATAPSASSAR